MEAKEFYQESAEQEEQQQILNLHEIDESDETLSFSDLPIYSDATAWEEEFSKNYHCPSSSSSSASDQDCFEFFSGEWSSTTTSLCVPESDDFEFFSEEWSSSRPFHGGPENIVFCGKIIPCKQPQIISKSPRKTQFVNTNGPELQKAKFLVGRVPKEMELRDMRRRQKRKSRSLVGPAGGDKETIGVSRWKGLWAMVRILGCGGSHHATAMVKASFFEKF